jgi:hypothetical protein
MPVDEGVGMRPVRFLESVRLPERLAAFSEAIGRATPCSPALEDLSRAVALEAAEGRPVDKERLLDLAALVLDVADGLARQGRTADALVLEGLEGLLLESVVAGE